MARALGFPRGVMPCPITLGTLLAGLDAGALGRALGGWLGGRNAAAWGRVALDGKTLKGSRQGQAPGLHPPAAYAPRASAVIARTRAEAATSGHEAALRLLGILPPLAGTVVTAGAMSTHADVCGATLQEEGGRVSYAGDNQARLQADIEAASHAAGPGGFSPRGPGGHPVRRPSL